MHGLNLEIHSPPPVCLLCFIWSIKEQYCACNCLLYMLPCDSAFVAGLFSRFWCSLLALQECWSNDRFSQYMAKTVSISRTRNMCWYRRRWLWVTLQISESRQKWNSHLFLTVNVLQQLWHHLFREFRWHSFWTWNLNSVFIPSHRLCTLEFTVYFIPFSRLQLFRNVTQKMLSDTNDLTCSMQNKSRTVK